MPSNIDVESEVRGTTLKVYLYIMVNGPTRIRDIQRGLGFSTPSLAYYHVEKLVKLGLVEEDEDGFYRVSKKIELSILKPYIVFSGRLIPRLMFYAVFFISFLVSYIILSWSDLNLYTIIVTAIATVIFWYETIKAWRNKPF
ncbi:MAG: winged helix-turn-helix domain-containing protein [Candidatus Bathyarchaeia archaeon]|nr:winged helix-turn-helix transcriptional regulator [Candidatus Bathyarchaeota archaeon]